MAQITDPLALPSDVKLLPVSALPERVRESLSCAEDDVAIQRLHSRMPSKVLTAQTALLLEQFHTANTIVDAIIHYSTEQHADPRAVLEEAFPVLQQLIVAKLLVPANSPSVRSVEARLTPGECVDGFRIVRLFRLLEDTELYQARQTNGDYVALKLARSEITPWGTYMLERETIVLHYLAGVDAPTLLASAQYQGHRYIAMEWLPGVTVDTIAAEIRGTPDGLSRLDMLNLMVSILKAYARLHSKGVLHGDVHPSNLLVDAKGAIKLIDFGLASIATEVSNLAESRRGGVAFFYEPELAEAIRADKAAPVCTELSEQYSLAALIYYLITGLHYLNFSLEHEAMLRQIAEEPPLSFAAQGITPWPAVETILSRALSKDPSKRFPTISAFAAAFELLLATDKPEGDLAPVAQLQNDSAQAALQRELFKRVAWDGELFKDGLDKPPTASVHTGAAGIAYTLYRAALHRSDTELLALADIWASRAAQAIGTEYGFFNLELEMTPAVVGTISPYHTATGIYAVQALIAQAMGNRVEQTAAIAQFVMAARQFCTNLDVTFGISGVLVVGALLYESLTDKLFADQTGLRVLGQQIMAQLWSVIDRYPAIEEAKQLPNLGIAHGWGGLLYATLRWCESTHDPLPATLGERLSQLAYYAEPVGRGVRWPWQLDQPGLSMPGWCNGSAGYLFLWPMAARMMNDASYWALAERTAWNCWEDPAQIASLCCGLAGRAYALLHWYKRTGDTSWLRRAQILTNQAAINIRILPENEMQGFTHSLYKGELGVVTLITDLANPNYAAMPLFETEYGELC